MSEFTTLREAVDTLADRALPPAFDDLKRRATRRGRRRVVLAAAATAGVIAGLVLVIPSVDDDRRTAPVVEQPEPVVGGVPVWYDAKGLHRGDVVERTPVEIGMLDENTDTLNGALALVRSGAVYLDPATGDVWFHPWGGDPRIVGHNSAAGPGGDPRGDTAAWFEGSDALEPTPGELVVYDTAAGREISRTEQSHGVTRPCCEHRPPGSGFLQVSADRVVWNSGGRTYRYDVRSRTTTVLPVEDVHDHVEVFSDSDALALKAPGRPQERYPDLEGFGRLSPSGNYVLAVEQTKERHGAVIIDTRTGELWRVPKDVYPWIAWSYGDVAMVDHMEDELLACDPARRTCKSLPAERPFLMPTN